MTQAPEIPSAPALLNPTVLVRDVAVVAALFVVGSIAWQDRAVFFGVAAGGMGAVMILRWMVRAVVGVTNPTTMAVRLALQFAGAFAVFFALLVWFPRLPAMVGFSSLIVGFGVRGVAGLWAGASHRSQASDSALAVRSGLHTCAGDAMPGAQNPPPSQAPVPQISSSLESSFLPESP